MRIARRLFVVPLADNDHGKSTMVRALASQGLGRAIQLQKKGVRSLTSPSGRPIDAYIFGRSYQEVEKGHHGSVENALDANDADWRTRELVIFPSHVGGIESDNEDDDIDQMIDVGHSAGFDVICAAVLITGPKGDDPAYYADVWSKLWDERWTIHNPYNADPKAREGQLEALGCDLWTWICRTLVL